MKTIIIYTSTNNCTQKAVRELSQKLTGEVQAIDIKNSHNQDLDDFDRIVVGGSIRGQKTMHRINQFYMDYMLVLRTKEIGLFVCSSGDMELAQEEIKYAFPEELHQLAKTEAIFSGQLDLSSMSFLKKFFTGKIGRLHAKESVLDKEAIDLFASQMDRTYHPFLLLI
jgi:Flavodoxin